MKFNTTRGRTLAVAGIGVAAVVVIGGTATAASQITAHQLATGAANHRVIADGSVHSADLTPGLLGKITEGRKDGLAGAVFRVENYENGGAGDATVACADDEAVSQKYTAIAGGVQAGHTGANTFSVTASFPGRMDWDTGKPKPNRLDGWIVLANGVHTDTLKVWALCVPTTDIPVDQVDVTN
jgi:hypothetical protein